MTLTMVRRPPPFEIYEACDAQFGIKGKRGVFFTIGELLFNPDGVHITPWLFRHEEVHSARQMASGNVNAWWGKYLSDRTFRFEEELAAHREEWKAIQELASSRQQRRSELAYICERLSSGLYGHLVTKARAKALITGEE